MVRILVTVCWLGTGCTEELNDPTGPSFKNMAECVESLVDAIGYPFVLQEGKTEMWLRCAGEAT